MKPTTLKTYQLLLPLIFLFILISFGLVIGPNYFGLKPFPLEIIFLFAAVFSAAEDPRARQASGDGPSGPSHQRQPGGHAPPSGCAGSNAAR